MFLVYGGLFFLLFGRVLYIQATGEAEGKAMASMAEAKYARESTLTADRGTISDRNGELIAADTLSYRLIAVLSEKASVDSKKQRHVTDFEKTAAVLAENIPMEKEEILSRLTDAKKGTYQVEFGKAGRDISYGAFRNIKEQELPGIIFVEDKKRFYPNGVFASYLIGFAQREEDADGNVTTVGKMGLESVYNKQLNGTDGKMNFKSDKWGIMLPKSEKKIVPAQDGYNIQLTIDKTIQNFVEDAMNSVEKEYSPKKMLVVVVNPKTGEIQAMSQRPAFHPSTRVGLTDNWLNQAVETTIEPGSTMKMFTVAAAMEENKWTPTDFYKSGQYKVYGDTVRDHNQTGWGYISFLEGFQRSSNVSMAYLLERMGDKKFMEYIRDFGFGEKTGIDLPHEASGRLLDTYPIERLTTSFGQGSTVTLMQMVQAATAIANDGVMMKPYVIDKITNPNNDKVVQDKKPEEHGQPISAGTAKQVRELLATTVTSEHGTGKKFALNGYTLGGKTGTAEIPNPNGPGYLSGNGNYLYSFLGMAPAEDPQLLTYVVVQQPKLKVGEIGSDPVAKLFTSIMENSLKYMNIVPNDEDAVEASVLDDFTGEASSKAINRLQQDGFSPILIGKGGKINSQYPQKESKLSLGSIVLLHTEGQTNLPDFTGWSKKMVLSFKLLSGLDIRINGEGYVTEQSLSKGTVIGADEPIVIQLQPPSIIHKPKEEELTEESIVGG
ncbi:penicillin-binding transpeptidase domain-containing protein [Filibacter tadaridae]|uniref:Penicillin-binding protein 2B n=1 Tax=Filibacter tadaridae TaxID=2483811 RepID=A0A3P5X5R9_9BACL|nr:penicillin-binding transpeptidase domain-containing protein [Filibacter tadaridae]VDC29846.1 Penicillin-binding protein 2B [Filibacter tadaridae]